MRVLVACEFSGIVRDAFRRRGHLAVSCDLLPSQMQGLHYQCDVRELLYKQHWDLMIAFPPCTRLCRSGARWIKERGLEQEQEEAISFVRELMGAPIPRIAIENPIGILSTRIRKPDQIIQPWQFGHGEPKSTCLWLDNLPLLEPTDIVEGRETRIHHIGPRASRSTERSITYPGIASAMADQWGTLECKE